MNFLSVTIGYIGIMSVWSLIKFFADPNHPEAHHNAWKAVGGGIITYLSLAIYLNY